MKRIVKVIALGAVLGVVTIGCQKESSDFPQTTIAENMETYKLSYYLDGTLHHTVLYGESALDDFLRNMIALAKEGYRVNISGRDSRTLSTKEVVIYTTNSEEDALEWSKSMIKQGYDVDISYNPRTGIYTCTAVK